MKYRAFIERYFLIDEPKSGQLVPFKFRPVQIKYYDELVRDYDIEERGLTIPVRELILKARREGFSSLILALFAVDDLMSETPTESLVISYKDDATKTFRKRYRTFLTSYGAQKLNYTVEQVTQNPNILEQVAKALLSIDSDEYELKHNKARFYCGTASARVGGRGGVVQKLLFSEAAFYPDKRELRSSEIIEGTMRQVDLNAGWVFVESTANGDRNHYAKMWTDAESLKSRFKHRFYGWPEFYSQEEFELICREFTDKRMIPQEYPKTAMEAFLSSGDRFFDPSIVSNLEVTAPIEQRGDWLYYGDFTAGCRFALGADVSEGVGRHNSTVVVLNFDFPIRINNQTVKKAKVVGIYCSNKIAPDTFAYEVKAGGAKFGNCIACPERNNHGFTTIAILKGIYANIYRDETERMGWNTTLLSKPHMMHELRTALHEGLIEISDAGLKAEIVAYPAVDLNQANVNEEDETVGHYDRTIALAIAWQMRSVATMADVMSDERYAASVREEAMADPTSIFNELP